MICNSNFQIIILFEVIHHIVFTSDIQPCTISPLTKNTKDSCLGARPRITTDNAVCEISSLVNPSSWLNITAKSLMFNSINIGRSKFKTPFQMQLIARFNRKNQSFVSDLITIILTFNVNTNFIINTATQRRNFTSNNDPFPICNFFPRHSTLNETRSTSLC